MKLLENILLLFVAYYLTTAPYTKVEESFNIQAIHDLIYNDGTGDFDHLLFPGVVPRTFVGAWFVATVDKLVHYLAPETTKFTMQIIARSTIGLFNFFSLVSFKRSVSKLYGSKRGSQIGNWFLFLVMGQFHILYYLSRPLPNMFALPLVLTAYSWILASNYAEGLRLMAFTAILFRSELFILCFTLAACLKYNRKLPLLQVVFAGASGTLLGGILSLLVDSKYWNEFPMVPEVNGFIFNVLEGKSSQWGTDPWGTYFTRHLPNMLGSPLLVFLGGYGMLATPRNLQILGLSAAAYIFIYSFQPHKELRFIIYVAPVFTALAARGIDYIYYTQIKKTVLAKVLYAIVVLASMFTVATSLVKLHISADNYPGGAAIKWFNENARANSTVHADVLSSMTGITRFQYVPGFVYDKTEGEALESLWPSFDYYIGDVSSVQDIPGEWALLHSVSAFQGLRPKAVGEIVRDLSTHKLGDLGQLGSWSNARALLVETWYRLVQLEPAVGVYERVGN